MEMVDVKFHQFMFPDGRKEVVFIKRPIEIGKKAEALWRARHSLEIENNNGMIFMSVIDNERDIEVSNALVPNGPDVPKEIDSLITNAFERLKPNPGDE